MTDQCDDDGSYAEYKHRTSRPSEQPRICDCCGLPLDDYDPTGLVSVDGGKTFSTLCSVCADAAERAEIHNHGEEQ